MSYQFNIYLHVTELLIQLSEDFLSVDSWKYIQYKPTFTIQQLHNFFFFNETVFSKLCSCYPNNLQDTKWCGERGKMSIISNLFHCWLSVSTSSQDSLTSLHMASYICTVSYRYYHFIICSWFKQKNRMKMSITFLSVETGRTRGKYSVF